MEARPIAAPRQRGAQEQEEQTRADAAPTKKPGTPRAVLSCAGGESGGDGGGGGGGGCRALVDAVGGLI